VFDNQDLIKDGALALLMNESDTDEEGKDDLIEEENLIRNFDSLSHLD